MRAGLHDHDRFDSDDKQSMQPVKPAARTFVWHAAETDPLPVGVPVLASEADGTRLLVRLDESGYLFDWGRGDDIDPNRIAFWGYLPAAPGYEDDESEEDVN